MTRIYTNAKPMDYTGDLRSMSREDAEFWAWKARQKMEREREAAGIEPFTPSILQRIFRRAT